MYTIIGSGFGLYGYLPALIEQGADGVILPLGYRDRYERRTELARYARAIRWVDDQAAALACASGVVIAVSPALQPAAVARVLARPNVRRLVLEKPLAATPEEAARTLRSVGGRRVRVGYTLLYADWYRGFRSALADARHARISITWHFTAHHFRHRVVSWKRFHSQGGGMLRFYGIHLVALLADAGYDVADDSQLTLVAPDEPQRWQASFSGPGLPACTVDVHGRMTPDRFAVELQRRSESAAVIDDVDPFASSTDQVACQDRRVAPVAKLIGSFDDDDERWSRLYARTNALWRSVESRTVMSQCESSAAVSKS